MESWVAVWSAFLRLSILDCWAYDVAVINSVSNNVDIDFICFEQIKNE
jgi:hypothetical protein